MNSRQLNIVLIGVNLGLVGVLIAVLVWAKRPLASPEVLERNHYIDNTVTQLQVRKFVATNLLEELSKMALGWAAVESTNYVIYMRNLRNLGCPDQTIQDIILTDLGKLYQRRMRALLGEAEPFEYWRTLGEGEVEALNPQLEADLAALKAERNRLARDLLGVDFEAEMARYQGELDPRERMYAFLAEDKRQRVLGVMDSFARLEQDLLNRSGGMLMPADEEQLRLLDRQKQEELAKILTAEEMTLYELNLSPLASELRYELNGFNPTPEEFQSIYNLRKNYAAVMDTVLQDPAVEPAVREQALQDAERLLEEQMRQTLGESRYGTLEQARDPDYQFLIKWADRYQVSPEVAGQVYQMKQAAEIQRQRVEENLELSFEQRQQAYQAIARETERSLSGLLGADTFGEYRKAGGQWIEALHDSDVAFELIVPEIREVVNPSAPQP